MTMQQILSPMRRAITDYSMIKDGDNIVIGLSGGKEFSWDRLFGFPRKVAGFFTKRRKVENEK